jgi:hypothetical protein
MPPAGAYIGVLNRYRSPFTVDLAHDTGTNAGALGLVNVAINVELGMHHRYDGNTCSAQFDWRPDLRRAKPPRTMYYFVHQRHNYYKGVVD